MKLSWGNGEKIAIVFSGNMSTATKTEIKNLLSNSQIQQYEKYLGLPLVIGRSKTPAFESIKQRVWQKLQYWKKSCCHKVERKFY